MCLRVVLGSAVVTNNPQISVALNTVKVYLLLVHHLMRVELLSMAAFPPAVTQGARLFPSVRSFFDS